MNSKPVINANKILFIPDYQLPGSISDQYLMNLKGRYPRMLVDVYEEPFDGATGKTHREAIQNWISDRPAGDIYEVHAQGTLGAMLAYEMLFCIPDRIRSIFFIGGASSTDMLPKAKRKLWFDKTMTRLGLNHTTFMRGLASELLQWQPYVDYLGDISHETNYVRHWLSATGVNLYYIPNGEESLQTYAPHRAYKHWRHIGVRCLAQPDARFYFRMLTPARQLFDTMDSVRILN